MNTCLSDIYRCEVCGRLLEYAADEEGEALEDTPLVCENGGIVYRVNMDTGELVRTTEAMPDDWPIR